MGAILGMNIDPLNRIESARPESAVTGVSTAPSTLLTVREAHDDMLYWKRKFDTV